MKSRSHPHAVPPAAQRAAPTLASQDVRKWFCRRQQKKNQQIIWKWDDQQKSAAAPTPGPSQERPQEALSPEFPIVDETAGSSAREFPFQHHDDV